MNTTASILVVDDNATNLGVLFHALKQAGYTVRVVNSGALALASARRLKPDLILLDVMMPQLDGFETCRRLKSDPATNDIPILFLTARSEAADEAMGLRLGAVDYITKPVQIETALARVQTQLTLRRLHQTLRQQNADLEAYARTVAHDLKNPLTAMLTAAQMILMQDGGDPGTIRSLTSMILRAGQGAAETVDSLLALAGVRQSDVVVRPLQMDTIVQGALRRVSALVAEHGGTVSVPDHWPAAGGYAPWVELVWANYLSNGLKYGGRPPQLAVGADCDGDEMVRFWVRDNGPGLKPEARAKLFVEWGRQHEGVEGHGLGLALVRRIVERLGGTVGITDDDGAGTTFFFTLPRAHQAEHRASLRPELSVTETALQ
jgi:signal transduction histidine kinase